MMDDGEGTPMYQNVEFFADNNKAWIYSFVDVFSKMQSNGYTNDQLKIQNLDGSFWDHME